MTLTRAEMRDAVLHHAHMFRETRQGYYLASARAYARLLNGPTFALALSEAIRDGSDDIDVRLALVMAERNHVAQEGIRERELHRERMAKLGYDTILSALAILAPNARIV